MTSPSRFLLIRYKPMNTGAGEARSGPIQADVSLLSSRPRFSSSAGTVHHPKAPMFVSLST